MQDVNFRPILPPSVCAVLNRLDGRPGVGVRSAYTGDLSCSYASTFPPSLFCMPEKKTSNYFEVQYVSVLVDPKAMFFGLPVK